MFDLSVLLIFGAVHLHTCEQTNVYFYFFFLHLIHSPTASPEISFFQLTFFGCFSVSKGVIWEERLLYAWQIVKPLKANNKDSVVPNKAVSATIVLFSMKSLGWNGFYAGSRHHSESRIKVTMILLSPSPLELVMPYDWENASYQEILKKKHKEKKQS